MSKFINGLFLTLKYSMLQVQGCKSIPPTSFPARMGCSKSDMFRVSLTDEEFPGGVSLAQFHAAFLFSPLFQLEIWIFTSLLKMVDPITTSKENLRDVAMGEKSTFGPWTAWAVEGHRTESITTTFALAAAKAENTKDEKSIEVSSCQIMRCRIKGQPFCDTWWAVECSNKSKKSEEILSDLVFGTAMIVKPEEESTTKTFLIKLFDPVHRLYSRLLLGNAKATLVLNQQEIKKSG